MNSKLRALAIATGLVIGVTGSLGVGLFFVVLPVLLIIGALVEPYSDAGRALVWAGALCVTFPGLLFGYAALDGIRRWPKGIVLPMDPLLLLSFLLVVACDLVLLIDALRSKRWP